MGNKIITEKDFFECSGGMMPSPFQAQQSLVKRKDNAKYILKTDVSTVSWVDFGCKKVMLLYAVVAAVAAAIAALCVATGGAALIAICAIAGAAGAVFGAVVGSLICGQLVAPTRMWNGSKSNFKICGINTITGDHTITCTAFTYIWMSPETIIFNPNIKSWGQAIAKGAASFIGNVFEGMMAGAAIGAVFAGGAALAGSGSWANAGRMALNFFKSIPKNFGVNILESFSKFGLGMRGVMSAQNVAGNYGETGSLDGSGKAVWNGFWSMETGTVDSVKNICSGNATWQDIVGLGLNFLPVGEGKRQLEDSLTNKADDIANKSDDMDSAKVDDADSSKADDTDNPTPKAQADADTPTKKGDGDAYEMGNQSLVDDMIKRTEEKIKNNSRNSNGPCHSGVYDPITGETSYGQNFAKNVEGNIEYNKFVEDAHPLIQERIMEQQKRINNGDVPPKTDRRAGAHSEVRALDESIKAREKATGKPVTEADLPSFDVHNRHMPSNEPFVRCPNCSFITDGVNTIGHD